MLSSGKRGRGGVTGRGGGKSSSFSPIFVKKLPGCFGAFPSAARDGGSDPPGFFATIGPNDFGFGSAWFSRVLVSLFADVALAGRICGVDGADLGGVNGLGELGCDGLCAAGGSVGLLTAAGSVGLLTAGGSAGLKTGGSGLMGSTGLGVGGWTGGGVGVGNGSGGIGTGSGGIGNGCAGFGSACAGFCGSGGDGTGFGVAAGVEPLRDVRSNVGLIGCVVWFAGDCEVGAPGWDLCGSGAGGRLAFSG